MHAAIEGLIHESSSAAQPSMLQSWVDLIHRYVLRFATPLERDDRLHLLWQRVMDKLSEDWTLARLAKEAGYSGEHLRRLCQKQLGRSPMHVGFTATTIVAPLQGIGVVEESIPNPSPSL